MKTNKKTIFSFKENKKRIFFGLLIVLWIPFFSGCTDKNQSYSLKLEVWGVFDESLVYNDVINKYKELNPHITDIKYRKFSQETYKQELLDALASGQGPDIFLINSMWLPSFENKLESAPAGLLGERDMSDNFPDVVLADFISGGKVFASPLSLDSLQLYYNKDLFNASGIAFPPKTWQELSDDVQKISNVDATGNIVKAGVAMGTTQNVSRYSDIISLLMLQNGAELPTKKGDSAKIDQGVIDQKGNVIKAGEQALVYYTQFSKVSVASNISNPLYCWNNAQNNSIEAFARGNVAMIAGYSWQSREIKSKNPKLNFSVAPIPQANLARPLTVANYWAYAVSKNKIASSSKQVDDSLTPVSNEVRTYEAWQFLRFLTLKNAGKVTLYNAITKNSKDFSVSYDPALEYLKKTQQPAARRDIIDLQKSDGNLGVFASGNLIAKSWYQVEPESIEKIFADGIDSIVKGEVSLHQALLLINNRLNVLMQAKK
ncbi:MAG: extracellular solute-binding protein [Candidatus Moranbacteria bacterium]|nr:extracellular solute-binding protein [Candidatus Moranbacteria bacterium]